MISNKNVLYAVAAGGYGHAQRSLPIIRYLLENNNTLTIVSYHKALKMLKDELAEEKKVSFIELEDIPNLDSGKGIFFYLYIIYGLIKMNIVIWKEHKFAVNFCRDNKIDFVISDGRYGFHNKEIPSFLVCHQLRIITPKLLRIFQPFADFFQFLTLKKFTKVIVPDFQSEENNLSGKLSHNWIAGKLKPIYIGYLSTLRNKNVNCDIDILFIIGGYIEHERKKLIESIAHQLKDNNKKKVFVLGDSKAKYSFPEISNSEVYDVVFGEQRNDLMNRSKLIIGRTGYTTLLDLCEIKKPGLLTPTKNMAEQNYLAELMNQKGIFGIFDENNLPDLNAYTPGKLPEFILNWSARKALETLMASLKQIIKD